MASYPSSAAPLRSRALAALVIVATMWEVAHGQPTATAYQVKAAYLYNFANYVTWPAAAFDGASGPFRVCTIGGDVFGSVLSETLRDDMVDAHPFRLIPEPRSGQRRSCHILFVLAQARGVDALLAEVAGAPVLTVGEGERFIQSGGILQFVIENDRVRFDVNLPAASGRGLTLSSRLLQVARKVQQ